MLHNCCVKDTILKTGREYNLKSFKSFKYYLKKTNI